MYSKIVLYITYLFNFLKAYNFEKNGYLECCYIYQLFLLSRYVKKEKKVKIYDIIES